MIVVDASVAVKWTVAEALHAEALSLTRGDYSLIAPNLVVIETLNVLRRKLKRSEILPAQLNAAAKELPGIFDLLVPESSLSERIERLAEELDHSVYDCAYLACALQLDVPLVTADLHFSRKLQASQYRSQLITLVSGVDAAVAARQSQASIFDQAIKLWKIFDQTVSYVRDSVLSAPGRFGFLNTSDLRPAFESPAQTRIVRFLASLPESEKVRLLALAWYGRSYVSEPWEEVLQRAEQHVAMKDPTLDRYIVSTFFTLEAG